MFTAEVIMKKVQAAGIAVLCIMSLCIALSCANQSASPLFPGTSLDDSQSRLGTTLVTVDNGGVVRLNSEVSLQVPENSVEQDTEISIERISDIPEGDTGDLKPFGQAYRFSPAGTAFSLTYPAQLDMCYDSIALQNKGFDPETLQLFYYDEEEGSYLAVNSQTDIAGKKLSAQLEHFTIYVPMAKARLSTNNPPTIVAQATVPGTMRAGAPIYFRMTARDYDGSLAGVRLYYRKLKPTPGAWQDVAMVKDERPGAVDTYGYLLPADYIDAGDVGTGAEFQYHVVATDNLGKTTRFPASGERSGNVRRTYQPGSIKIAPATQDMSVGFQQYFTVNGRDTAGTTFSFRPESFSLAYNFGTIINHTTSGLPFKATIASAPGVPELLTVNAGSDSAIAQIIIHAGALYSMAILDTNGMPINGTLNIVDGIQYAFDAVGYDEFGNTIPVYPAWSADPAIGSIDADGVLDTIGKFGGTGSVTGSLGNFTDTKNIVVFNQQKEITAYSINGIDGEIHFPFITVTLPWGTDVTALVPQFTINGVRVAVDGTDQVSGVSTHDFTNPVVYTVYSENGLSQDYTVSVRTLKPYKEILAFSVYGKHAQITGNTITVNVLDQDRTAIVASFITNGERVTVNGADQTSGVTVNDFTNPVVYTVIAEDGTTREYTVIIHSFEGRVSTFAGKPGGMGYHDGTGSDARFYYPQGVCTDGSSLFIADTTNHMIRKVIIATGVISTIAGSINSGSSDGTGTAAGFYSPKGISTDGTFLYVADTQNHTIRKIVIATGEVTTLAGLAGNRGSSDGTGSAARFADPRGITIDGAYLYVADSGNHIIRSIVIATGEVTTVAGSPGSAGSSDGTGSSARFSNPYGICSDGIFLYVADADTHIIRRVVKATGEVVTIAGSAGSAGSANGIGSGAQFYCPSGITTDGTSLFVAENSNHQIRKIDIATREVTTFAGSTTRGSSDGIGESARFSQPQGITTDGTSLFVADSSNGTIRTIVIASREVSTLAGAVVESGTSDGNGIAARFNGPAYMASDGTYLYVADVANYTIRRIEIASGAVSTFAGSAGNSGYADGIGSSAGFGTLGGIATDGTFLYVADSGNHILRKKVIATAEVTTLAGSAGNYGSSDGIGTNARLGTPAGLTINGDSLFVAERGNCTVRKVIIETGEVTTFAGSPGASGYADGIGSSAKFYLPYDITTDGTSLYVADTWNQVIRKIDIATREVSTIAGTVYAGMPIFLSTDGIGAEARFSEPMGLTTDGTCIFVADTYNSTIRKIVIATNEVSTIAGSPAFTYQGVDDIGNNARFYYPRGIVLVNGCIYVADLNNHAVRKIE